MEKKMKSLSCCCVRDSFHGFPSPRTPIGWRYTTATSRLSATFLVYIKSNPYSHLTTFCGSEEELGEIKLLTILVILVLEVVDKACHDDHHDRGVQRLAPLVVAG
jgi:hypothetical protein